MKPGSNFILFIISAFIILYSSNLHAQQFAIEGSWKINFEDKKEFCSIDYNDDMWAQLYDLKWSDDRKTTANRVLWIRKTVVIPSSLQPALDKTGLLVLSMGKILQSDNTYLNGKLIGSTGSGDSYRNYLIKKDNILWDKENTIAIKVSHWGEFRVLKIPVFTAAAPAYLLTYSSGIVNGDHKAPVLQKDLTYQLIVTNQSPKSLNGSVKADFYDFGGTRINSIEKNVNISSGKNTVDFPFTSPSPFLKIVYTLHVPDFGYSQVWNAEFGYQDLVYKSVMPVVAYQAPQKYLPADLDKQSISGWLGERLKANTEQRLEKVDEDAILAGFINRPGSHSWIGEHVGKFLDAACNAYANNGDPALKVQIDRTAQQLIAAQLPDGYLGTYELDSHFTSWDVWSHRYDLIGLLHYYQLSGFKPALAACEKIGNLLVKTFGTEKGQRDIVQAGGHVGMAATCILESMAELYRFSGDKKYLDFCYYVVKSFDQPNGPKIISTLDAVGRVDKVANAKAYEMLSNLLGVIKMYRLTNDKQFLKPVLAAWKDISEKRLYITGTASSFEHFHDDGDLPAENGSNMGEGCVTTTWIQFSYQMLCITGEMKYVNELERSVYNHLTGAENPETGCVSYYTPLIGVKPYGCSITCCMSSVPRAISMIPLFTNGKINNIPTFLFYGPGVYSTKVASKNVSFTTSTAFPSDGNISIDVNAEGVSKFPVGFRKPYWAENFTVLVNGQKQTASNAGTLIVERTWKKGDKVSINFSMPTIVLDGGKSYPGKIALQRGPQILTFDRNINGIIPGSIAVDAKNIHLQTVAPTFPKNWIGGEAFQLEASVDDAIKNILLVPYADAGQTSGAIDTWLRKKTN